MSRIVNFINKPFNAFVCYFIWIIVMFMLVATFNEGEGGAFVFGPGGGAMFLGTEIDSWDKVIKVYAFGFFASLFTNISNHVTRPWITNTIYDPKERWLGMSKKLAFLTANGTFLLGSIDQILTILVVMTGQVQYFIPGQLSMLIVTMATTWNSIGMMQERQRSVVPAPAASSEDAQNPRSQTRPSTLEIV